MKEKGRGDAGPLTRILRKGCVTAGVVKVITLRKALEAPLAPR